jgi:hypothetical protein
MIPTSISTYHQKRQWIFFSAIAVLLSVVSFFAPSRLTEASLSEIVEIVEFAGFWTFLSMYSLLLVPVAVVLIAINKFKTANILISLCIVCQLDDNYSIHRLLFFDTEAFLYVWFLFGGTCYFLLYKEFKNAFLKKNERVLLLSLAGLFTAINLFLALEPALRFGPFEIFTIFCLILMLFNASDKLTTKWYWTWFVIIAGLAAYMLTIDLNCNIEFFGDVGLPNNNLSHILNVCSTYYLWLSVGFLLAISARQKMIISAQQKH